MKKLLSIVLAVAMVIGCVAVTGIFASAEDKVVIKSGNLIENGDFEASEVGATVNGMTVVQDATKNSKAGTYHAAATYSSPGWAIKEDLLAFSAQIGATKSFVIKMSMDLKTSLPRGDQFIQLSIRNFINNVQKTWNSTCNVANQWFHLEAEYEISPAELATLGATSFCLDHLSAGADVTMDNVYVELVYEDVNVINGKNVLPAEKSTFETLEVGATPVLDATNGAVVAKDGENKVITYVPSGSWVSPQWILAPTLKKMAGQLGEYESFQVKVSLDFKTSNVAMQYAAKLIMRGCAGRVTAPVADSNNNVTIVNKTGTKDTWYTVSGVFTMTPADIAAMSDTGYTLCLDGVTKDATYSIDNVFVGLYIANDLTVTAGDGDTVKIDGAETNTIQAEEGQKVQIEVTLADSTKQLKGLSDGTTEYPAVDGVVEYTMGAADVTLTVVTEDIRDYTDEKNVLPENITNLSGATAGPITDAYGKLGFGGTHDAAIVEKDGAKVFTYSPDNAWNGPSVSIAPYVIKMAEQLDLKAGESFDIEISFALMLDGTGEVSNAGIAGFLFRDLRGNVSCLDDITNAGAANSYMGLGHCGTSKGTWNKVTKIVTFTYEDVQGMITEGAAYNLTFDQSVKNGTYFLKDLNVRYYVEPQEDPNQGGSKPEGTGDVLPVALIATVALASVALVVVSKKRKED
ncbi:MAG: hypothetical protein IKB86_07190 [Clostridia bacterium]|nr:hypothetical protein [Clostridia bacterium]